MARLRELIRRSVASRRRARTTPRRNPARPRIFPDPDQLEVRTLLAVNPIVVENQLPGNPPSEWRILNGGDTSIQGFATDISVDQGQTVSFKINDPSRAPYRIEIFRLGYYAGLGARRVATIPSTQTLRVAQPSPLVDTTTGLVDAGNWSVAASWAVPSDATSGIYIANLIREDTGGASQIVFVVRDDDGGSDLLFQTSDTTWQAYNSWGGNSLYVGNSGVATGRAVKVSYNRPLTLEASSGGLGSYNSLFHGEYPMVRWLEANGYNVSYFTNVDTDRLGSEILEHKTFLSVGHDEYWSAAMRANVEAARDSGVNLGFFSGNEVYWKVRWETSIDGSGTPYRTLVCYKESKANAKIDPSPVWTGTWRDDRFSPPYDGGNPENALTGTAYMNDRTSTDLGLSMNVSAADGQLRFWRNTAVAALSPGQVATLGEYVVGYETDEDLDNGFRPAGLITMSSTTFNTLYHVIVPWGSEVGPGTSTHKITLYRAPSGALVFGAGTVQWSWGLDGQHNDGVTTPDPSMQQATVNLLADMNVQPATLQAGLVPATATTDITAPTSTITSIANGANVTVGSTVILAGTATDSGGGVVGGVEVSVDGGRTWRRATGRGTWSYSWVVDTPGPVQIKSRAVDDSGNLESPTAAVSVSAAYTPTSTTGLVAAYNFDEASGATVLDTSGRGNNGTISGAARVPGLFGNALSFNGTSDWVTIADASSLDLTSGMTLQAWVKPTAPANNWTTVLLKERTGGLSYALYAADSANQPPAAYIRGGTDDLNVRGNTSLPIGTWTFLAATYDGTTLKLYVNGVLIASRDVSRTITTSTGALRIGGNSVYGEFFTGLIDQVRIYNRPLNLGEIRADMSTPVGSSQVEGTAPSAAMTGPSNGATVSGVATLSASASDNVRVAAVQFLLDGVPVGPELTAAPYTFSWDTRKVVNGSHVLRVRARDMAGNTSTSAGVTVTVSNPADLTPPAVRLLNPTGSLLTSGTIVPWAVATDNIGVAGVQFRLNGVAIGPEVIAAPYRFALDTSTVADGEYQLTAVARDAAGNTAVSDATTLRIDNTRPTVTDRSPAPGAAGLPTTGLEITAAFSEPVQPSTIAWVLRDQFGNVRAATVSYDEATRTATLTPAGALNPSATYTVELLDARDMAGNALAPLAWTFSTTSLIANASLWSDATIPPIASTSDTLAYELGVKFRSDVGGYVTGVRFYKGPANVGTHVGRLWTAGGALLASATFTSETATGWQRVDFADPVPINAGVTYIVSYTAPLGGYAYSSGFFAGGVDAGVLHAPSSAQAGGNGVFGSPGSFPTSNFNAANYWVDVLFSNTLIDATPPSVTTKTPAPNATGVATTAAVTATFSEAVQPSTIGFTLRGPGGSAVAATVTYDATSRTATFTPAQALTPFTIYTASLSGVQDEAGNVMAPVSWSFTTQDADTTPPTVSGLTPAPGATGASTVALTVAATFSEPVQPSTIAWVLRDQDGNLVETAASYDAASRVATLTPTVPLRFLTTYTVELSGARDLTGNLMTPLSWTFTTTAQVVNASLWGASATPAVASANDPAAYELGVKFRSDVGGYVTGVRFYKGPANVGTHVGRLWTAGGALLASATFTSETATGWQRVDFADPVPINAGVTYIVSYSAPSGGYAFNGGYFNGGVDAGVLHAPSSAQAGGNGVFGSPGSFPTSTFNAANYWVDVLFSNTLADTTPPTVTGQSPAPNATGVATTAAVTATFSEAVQPSTIGFTLRGPGGSAVAATVTYDAASRAATLTPTAPLSPSTAYTVELSGARDVTGNLMTPLSWTFTTAAPIGETTIWPATATPAVASASDSAAYELGVKFRSDVGGYVTGVRFYKGPANVGTHVGRLWTAGGALLASATFTSETATGWQRVDFADPVPINAGVTYIVSYSAPSGGYAQDRNYFTSAGASNGPLRALASGVDGLNGVFSTTVGAFPTSSWADSNYWVDVVFSTTATDSTPPSVAARSPASGATGVALNSIVTATFSEAVQPSTIGFTLRGPGGSAVVAAVAYDATSRTATLTPALPLSPSTTYTVELAGVADLAGNVMATQSWSFTTENLWIQTTEADFAAGSHDGTSVTNTAGGEVVWDPAHLDDFDGAALGPSWSSTPWDAFGGGPGSAVVSGGVLQVSGVQILSTTSRPGTGVEGRVNFAAVPYEHFGIATGLGSFWTDVWAIFSTMGTTDTLFARVNVAGTGQDVNLGALPSGFHLYRVQPTAGGFAFYVDGELRATISAVAFPIGYTPRIAMSTFNGAPSPALQVDWVRWTGGTFTSSVLDAGRTATWGLASWAADLPPGAVMVVETSSGDTATPDGTWSSWAAVGNGGTVASPAARYLRYRVRIDSPDPAARVTFSGISIGWR